MLAAVADERTILVVDDDPDLLAMVRRILTHDGHRVVTTPDPREALALYERERPALIVVDLMLPHMDGEVLLRRIDGLGGARPPVLILSASAIREQVAERTGAESLAKPFRIDDLREAVSRLLG